MAVYLAIVSRISAVVCHSFSGTCSPSPLIRRQWAISPSQGVVCEPDVSIFTLIGSSQRDNLP